MTNQDVIGNLESAHNIKGSMLRELDHRADRHGHIHFKDVVDVVDMVVDREVNPELFEACKRVLECERCITIHDWKSVINA